MNITFESKDLPIKTVTIKGRYKLRVLIWELYNKHIDSIIKVNINVYLTDDITCTIKKGS